ncbi:hypothetical protein SRB17_57040 [Streptomyces sp. RB17]|nr:hypothetical protein [Streptomyces sp. RB17]
MRVEVSAEFASMPNRTSGHTRSVNSGPGMWDRFHLIRCISEAKGLFTGMAGHMGHNRALKPSRNAIERQGVLLRIDVRTGSGAPPGLVCVSWFMAI